MQVGGSTAEFLDQQSALADGLPVALAILATTTLVILFLMTGSVVLPVKALIMNLLTLSAAFGILKLVFQDGRLEGLLDYTSQGALESSQPILLFAIAFGLSTDYGVFLLTRIKEARDGGLPNDEAVAVGLERTGPDRDRGGAPASASRSARSSRRRWSSSSSSASARRSPC